VSVSDIRRRVAEKMGGGSGGDKLLCRKCSEPTKRETLSDLGGQCFPCYQAYCREPQTFPDVGNKHARGPRDWAHALKRRHDAGELLTPAQIDAYRGALASDPLRQGGAP
jgi:hypothetical protein